MKMISSHSWTPCSPCHIFESNILISCEDICTVAHSQKGDKAHPRQGVKDESMSNSVRHISMGWDDEYDVTCRYPSLLTTTTKHNECPPKPSMIGYEDPPGLMDNDEAHQHPWCPLPGLTNIYSHDSHQHHWQVPITRIDEQPWPPTTTIDKRQQGPITTIDEWPWVPTMTNGHGQPWRLENGQ